ncbi:unnamed protein product [Owenia fusiformis]|uniref:Uncharacterized protein n=1 Tax=Owenia fusiformis TaxID=6347 RepID=A0A8S4N938_OWEFU|nr:unnamed protein product [Owenia fusiformis]
MRNNVVISITGRASIRIIIRPLSAWAAVIAVMVFECGNTVKCEKATLMKNTCKMWKEYKVVTSDGRIQCYQWDFMLEECLLDPEFNATAGHYLSNKSLRLNINKPGGTANPESQDSVTFGPVDSGHGLDPGNEMIICLTIAPIAIAGLVAIVMIAKMKKSKRSFTNAQDRDKASRQSLIEGSGNAVWVSMCDESNKDVIHQSSKVSPPPLQNKSDSALLI